MDGVTKVYQQGKIHLTALQNIDLEIQLGEFITLMGPSGSGKSTLLNLLGCLDQPTTGKIIIDELTVTSMNSFQLAALRKIKLGFIFQSYNLFPVLSALENVEYPLLLRKIPSKERRAKALSLLQKIGLEKHIHHKPAELSGGQQQRVAIARALVTEPKLILADEPTANLDSKTGSDILKLMKQFNQEKRITFIFATHDPRVLDNASRIIYMEDGSIISK